MLGRGAAFGVLHPTHLAHSLNHLSAGFSECARTVKTTASAVETGLALGTTSRAEQQTAHMRCTAMPEWAAPVVLVHMGPKGAQGVMSWQKSAFKNAMAKLRFQFRVHKRLPWRSKHGRTSPAPRCRKSGGAWHEPGDWCWDRASTRLLALLSELSCNLMMCPLPPQNHFALRLSC